MKQHTIRKSVPVNEIGAYLHGWETQKPGFVHVEVIGTASEYDIHAAVFTDPSVPDEEKQRILIIAQHSGMEISGINTVLSLGNYLAAGKGDDLLRGLVVVLLPCPNPWTFAKQSPAYTFRNEAGVDEYISFTYHGAKLGGRNPSAVAVQALIDRFRPEMLLDCHGVHAQDQLVIPSCGVSAFASNRLYNDELLGELQQAGIDAGYATFSADTEETLPMTDPDCGDEDVIAHFRPTARGAIAPTYAYYRYHTMAASLEISFECEAVERLVRALEIGVRTNKREVYPGYPVNCVVSPYGHASLRAYGITAAQRRESRIELWQKRGDIGFGIAHPEVPGFAAAIVTLDPAASSATVKDYYAPMDDVLCRLQEYSGKDMTELRTMFDAQFESYASINPADNRYAVHAEHGITIRLGLPFADAKPTKIMLCDRVLCKDAQDGYSVTECDNWVYVDVNIPPEKITPVMIAAVTYDCTVPHSGIVAYNSAK